MSLSYFRTPRMLIAAGLIVAGGAFLVACGVGQTPTAATSVAREIDTAGGGSVGALANNTLAICHLNDTGAFVPLKINPSAWGGHEKHGDGQPGGQVPGNPAKKFTPTCEEVPVCPCSQYLSDYRTSLTAYNPTFNAAQPGSCHAFSFPTSTFSTNFGVGRGPDDAYCQIRQTHPTPVDTSFSIDPAYDAACQAYTEALCR